MKDSEWKILSKRIISRDGSKCFKCAKRINLEVHHIIPREISHDNREQNLISLCQSHHRKADLAYRKYGKTHFVEFMLKTAELRSKDSFIFPKSQ